MGVANLRPITSDNAIPAKLALLHPLFAIRLSAWSARCLASQWGGGEISTLTVFFAIYDNPLALSHLFDQNTIDFLYQQQRL